MSAVPAPARAPWGAALAGLACVLAPAVLLAIVVELADADLALAEPTFETLATVAAALLVAYSVELVALVLSRPSGGAGDPALAGFAVGVGAGGLLGLAAAVGGAEWSRDVFEQTTIGSTLAVGALTLIALLGILVVLLPLLAWQRRAPDGSPGPGAPGR